MALIDLSLRQASDLLRKGQVSSVELTEAILQRINDVDSHVHAYLTVMSDLAIDQANKADRQLSEWRANPENHRSHPLAGIPIAIKELEKMQKVNEAKALGHEVE